MNLAGRYRQVVAYPNEISPGVYADQFNVNNLTIERYKQGDHLIWGGPQVGMFWASDVQTTSTLKPKSIEHAYEMVNKANKDLISTQVN
jgi:hypothetical protein